MILVILLHLCISLIDAQNNKTKDYGAIAKPHPKGMFMSFILKLINFDFYTLRK
jgi:hypothetical protein